MRNCASSVWQFSLFEIFGDLHAVLMVNMSPDKKKAYLPECWTNDLRMDSMFSDFRNRNVNPSDWDGKLRFWKTLVNEWCGVTGRLTFTFAEAKNAFVRNGRTPRGLKTVAQQMANDNSIMTLDAYLKTCSEPGWLSWTWDLLIRKPISYTWSFINNTLFQTQPEIDHIQYVNCDLIQEKAAAVLERHRTLVERGDEDNTLAMKTLARICKDICKTEKDLELCCLWLKKEKKLLLYREEEHVVVKFFESDSKTPAELSQMEKAVVQLRMVRKTLEHQIVLFENEIEKYTNEARAHLKAGSRTLAKTALQKKKQNESMLQKKEKTLENIEVLLNRLQDANTQKSVLGALQAGSAAFKLDQGMDLDKVDETMAAVQETLEMQEEIQEAVAHSVGPQTDMSELEAELQDILASGEPEVGDDQLPTDDSLMERLNNLRVRHRLSDVPSPPTESPERKIQGKTAVKI